MTKDLSLLFRLRNAVEDLATGKGDIRSRLKDIYQYLQPIQERDLPKKFRKDWSFVLDRFTKYTGDYYGETPIDASLRKMNNATGQKMARIIFKIWQYFEK